MAKREQVPIRTVSYIHVGGELVDTAALTAEQKVFMATKLKERFLNELFIGKAEFRAEGLPHEEKVFPRDGEAAG